MDQPTQLALQPLAETSYPTLTDEHVSVTTMANTKRTRFNFHIEIPEPGGSEDEFCSAQDSESYEGTNCGPSCHLLPHPFLYHRVAAFVTGMSLTKRRSIHFFLAFSGSLSDYKQQLSLTTKELAGLSVPRFDHKQGLPSKQMKEANPKPLWYHLEYPPTFLAVPEEAPNSAEAENKAKGFFQASNGKMQQRPIASLFIRNKEL